MTCTCCSTGQQISRRLDGGEEEIGMKLIVFFLNKIFEANWRMTSVKRGWDNLFFFLNGNQLDSDT